MSDRDALLAAIVADPADELAWLALADWLEETGEGPRAELLRLTRRLLAMEARDPKRAAVHARMCDLLAAGVEPCVPERVAAGMRFVLVPAGRFWPEGETEPVTVERPFWLGKFPVTQAQFERVAGFNPSAHVGDGRPVEQVELAEVDRFLSRLGKSAKRRKGFRLPTEWEWEHACRAGATATFHFGEELSAERAWYNMSDIDGTAPVGRFPPNAFGLHDMHGNVWEVCTANFVGDETDYVIKGGSCASADQQCGASVTLENDGFVEDGDTDLGFRVLMEWRGV